MTTNSTWAALRNPTFRKLWIAAVISGTCVAAHDSAATWMMNLITIIVVQRWYWCTGIQARVYSESLLTLILALATVAVTAALADDASMKKQFVGYWNSPGSSVWHLTEDGIMHLTPEPSTPWTWAVHDGVFHFSKGQQDQLNLSRSFP